MSSSTLHLTNGDSAGQSLSQAGLGGTVAVWADVLCEGPLPATDDPVLWRETRARHLAADGNADYAGALGTLAEWDAGLADAEAREEVVLWFEHDLYDQVLLVRHLDWFARHRPRRLSLICIDAFPGVVPFHGLGQLTPAQLATLFPGRQPVTAEQFALGRRAWAAFTAPDPQALDRLQQESLPALPFLAGAVRRYLEEYPAVQSGLGRTERTVLDLLSDGPRSPVELFRSSQAREERVFMGDTSFWRVVRGLSQGPAPAVALSGDPPDGRRVFPATRAELTETGRALLAGRADWIALTGVDRWHGGVHLSGRTAAWRWDPATKRIVTAA